MNVHEERLRQFENLESHVNDIATTKPYHFEKLVLSARAVREYSKTDLGLHEVTEYFSKVPLIRPCELTMILD